MNISFGISTHIFAGQSITTAKLKYSERNAAIVTEIVESNYHIHYSIKTTPKGDIIVELMYLDAQPNKWVYTIVQEIKIAIQEQELSILKKSLHNTKMNNSDSYRENYTEEVGFQYKLAN